MVVKVTMKSKMRLGWSSREGIEVSSAKGLELAGLCWSFQASCKLYPAFPTQRAKEARGLPHLTEITRSRFSSVRASTNISPRASEVRATTFIPAQNTHPHSLQWPLPSPPPVRPINPRQAAGRQTSLSTLPPIVRTANGRATMPKSKGPGNSLVLVANVLETKRLTPATLGAGVEPIEAEVVKLKWD